MSAHGLVPESLKQQHYSEIAEVGTFLPQGVTELEALNYLETEEGKKYLQLLRDAAPNASKEVIAARALEQVVSGRDIPHMEVINKPLVKIVPVGVTDRSLAYSPFFARQSEFEDAVAKGYSLNDRFGLPINSESPVYDVYRIDPKAPAEVFVSHVAPTSELGGQVTRAGGATQYLVSNRGMFTEAVRIGSIGNDLALHQTLVVDKGLGAPIVALGQAGPASEAATARSLRGATLAKGLGTIGVAATAYDTLTTASRASELRGQGSVLAAQSELNHFAARNVGAWAGAAAGAAIGWETGPGVVAFAAVGAVSTSAAGERIADWWDQQKIYRQTDRDGVDWRFNGRQWLRQEQADLRDDGVDDPRRQAFAALPDKAGELGYLATLAAVDLAAREAPGPQDPYRLPAGEGDRPSLRPADWRHDPDTGRWHRNVATGMQRHNDRLVHEPEIADPRRAAQLDEQAARIIAGNIANGPAARAARVDLLHRVNHWDKYGPLPDHLRAALSDPDTLAASDGERYRRGTDGIWRHDGQAAEGNLKLELEATRSALQPALAQHAEAMAAVQPRPALSPQERERADLAATYASHGISPDADTMAAIVLAVQRTRQSHGIDAATTALAPQPNAQGGYDVTSALAHLYRDADDVVRVAAVTSSQDIRGALDEIQGRSITGPSAANSTGPCNDTRTEVAAGNQAPARGNRPLADDPAHPDFHTFDRIHTWVRGTGQWDEQQSRNVACALYRQQAGDPLVKRVDRVVGGVGRDGAENVFAVYAPFGDKGPFFHARVDGREASQQPARQNLEQAEQINQQAMQREQAMQQRQEQRSAQLSM